MGRKEGRPQGNKIRTSISTKKRLWTWQTIRCITRNFQNRESRKSLRGKLWFGISPLLHKLLNPSVASFPCLQNWDNSIFSHRLDVCIEYQLTDVKHLSIVLRIQQSRTQVISPNFTPLMTSSSALVQVNEHVQLTIQSTLTYNTCSLVALATYFPNAKKFTKHNAHRSVYRT